MRRCRCGSFLSRWTKGDLCPECGLLKNLIEQDDRYARVRFAARHVAGIYAHPEDHDSAPEYLAALTASLDELCAALQMPPFRAKKAPWLVQP